MLQCSIWSLFVSQMLLYIWAFQKLLWQLQVIESQCLMLLYHTKAIWWEWWWWRRWRVVYEITFDGRILYERGKQRGEGEGEKVNECWLDWRSDCSLKYVWSFFLNFFLSVLASEQTSKFCVHICITNEFFSFFFHIIKSIVLYLNKWSAPLYSAQNQYKSVLNQMILK